MMIQHFARYLLTIAHRHMIASNKNKLDVIFTDNDWKERRTERFYSFFVNFVLTPISK